ncbi:MAG: Mrp/NBP35 family ATP-binding protein [candidate division Zixibacteria bacterium]|nr:Mrp/NBP35 family ATP-binding protein [candidate division Zixibacteria bacterium]
MKEKNPSEKEVLEALSGVLDPDLKKDLVSLGMIKDVKIKDGEVSFTIVLTTPACPLKGKIEKDSKDAVMKLPGVKDVKVKLDSSVKAFKKISAEDLIPNVKNTIAIASGKGGVGKSTVSVNLALALSGCLARVGLFDADLYGPTIPQMLGVKSGTGSAGKGVHIESGKIIPAEDYNLKIISIDFFLEESTPLIWRGPLVAGAIQQFLRDVDWGELDYMIIDLPPGTGDAQLTLAQTIPLTGAVIVTTPQDVAKKIAIKALKLFQQLNVPILGIIENMSYFLCPHCGKRSEIFSYGGGRKAGEDLGVPFLGEIPIDLNLRISGDEGKPFILENPDSEVSKIFAQIAGNLARQISILSHK